MGKWANRQIGKWANGQMSLGYCFCIWLAILLVSGTRCVGTDFIVSPTTAIPARVDIDPVTKAIIVGASANFQAVYYDTSGEQVATTFTWTSSNAAVATISANGMATGHQTGQVSIQAMTNGITSEPALLTVVMDSTVQVATVAVTAPGGDEFFVGEEIKFTAIAFNLNNAPVPNQTVIWRSTNPAVMTIDQTGMATAIAPGNTEIIAEVDGIESPPAKLTIKPLLSTRSGTFFEKRPNSYVVQGTATLEELTTGGRLILKFSDDFVVSNGPGLFVYLSPTSSITSSSIILEEEAGRLQGTRLSGAQTFEVPTGVKLNDHNFVIIRCVPFSVSFGCAELE